MSEEDVLAGKEEYDCIHCGSVYVLLWDPDEVDIAFNNGAEFCPFCGERKDAGEMPLEGGLVDLDMGFSDHAEFGKGIDLLDGEDE